MGVIGDDLLGLQLLRTTQATNTPLHPSKEANRSIHTALLNPDTLPNHSAGLEAYDVIVWTDIDPGRVSNEQLVALRNWVAKGGHLILSVTDSISALRNHSFADVLPARPVRAVTAPELGEALGFYGATAGAGVVALLEQRPTPGRTQGTRLTDSEGRPLIMDLSLIHI